MRNNVIFKRERFNVSNVLFRIRSVKKEWKYINELKLEDDIISKNFKKKNKIKKFFKKIVKWEFLSIDYIKINFDDFVKDAKAVTGYIIGKYNENYYW